MDLLKDLIFNVPDLTILEFCILFLSSFLTSTVTASFGLGGGSLLILIMVSIMNPLVIIPIHAIIQMSSNSTRAIVFRENINFTYMLPFVLGSLIGVCIAAFIIIDLPKNLIQSFIGIFILYSLYVPKAQNIKISNLKIGILGLISSFLTMFVGGTGPLIAPFVRSFKNDRKATVGTQATFMTFQHGIKIITFLFLGFSFVKYLSLILAMIIFGIIGTWVGEKILVSIPEKLFGNVFNLILTILAVRLLFEGLKQFI